MTVSWRRSCVFWAGFYGWSWRVQFSTGNSAAATQRQRATNQLSQYSIGRGGGSVAPLLWDFNKRLQFKHFVEASVSDHLTRVV